MGSETSGNWVPITGDEPFQLQKDERVITFDDSYSTIVNFRNSHKEYAEDHNACKTDTRLIEGHYKGNDDLIVCKWCLVEVKNCESSGRKNDRRERQTA